MNETALQALFVKTQGDAWSSPGTSISISERQWTASTHVITGGGGAPLYREG